MEKQHFDCIIIGGSYAGLSAALSLVRSMREVIVIDSGESCNRHTPHSHNFLTQDGKSPGEINSKALSQIQNYETILFQKEKATSVSKTGSGFEVQTENEAYRGKKLILATGLKDIFPGIPGFTACWGKSILHCPYCHGYEFRNQKTGILANGETAFHLAGLLNNLTSDITILTNGTADFEDEHLEKLKSHHIDIIETGVVEIAHEKGQIQDVTFADGQKIPLEALYAKLPFRQHSDIPGLLGCEFTGHGLIKADEYQRCSVENVYACGDNSSLMRTISNAVYTGNMAGAVVNQDLIAEQF